MENNSVKTHGINCASFWRLKATNTIAFKLPPHGKRKDHWGVAPSVHHIREKADAIKSKKHWDEVRKRLSEWVKIR